MTPLTLFMIGLMLLLLGGLMYVLAVLGERGRAERLHDKMDALSNRPKGI